ncbi:MAG TPA: hypothetical protein VK565_07500, partial [Gemmatimonadaceae bacterium]|nr:hypothetical protein [Gemmatimonadaceae bacterium]
AHQTVRWLPLAGTYLASGLVCGLVLGICRPLITSLSRSVLLGPVVAFPFYAIVGITVGQPFWKWDSVYWTIMVIAVVFIGSSVGAMYWLIFSQAQT